MNAAVHLSAVFLLATCISALANTENTFPYAESFELHQDGEGLVGTNGWYGSDAFDLTIEAETYSYSGDLPFSDATHSNVVVFDNLVENRFTGTDGDANAYVEFMIKPVLGSEPENIVTTNFIEYALYFNKAGHIVVNHLNFTWGAGVPYLPFFTSWSEMDHAPVSTDSFCKVTIELDYRSFSWGNPPRYIKFFRVSLNDTNLTHPDALTAPDASLSPPPEGTGTWFFCIDAVDSDHDGVTIYDDSQERNPAGNLKGYGVQGAGTIDDLFINSSTNVPTYDLAIDTTHAEARGVPAIPGSESYNYGERVLCSVTNSPVLIGSSTQLVCTGWTSGTGTVEASGSSTSVLVTMNEDSGLTWDWSYKFLLDTEAGAGGTVSLGDGWYDAGAEVSITAQPNESMVFDGWTGDVPSGSVSSNPLSLTMDQARNVLANFTSEGPTEEYTDQGTPYSWLDEYAALLSITITNYNTADLENWDEDGALNWEEHVAGTYPNNSNSVFEIMEVMYMSDSNKVVWYGTTNFGMTNPPFSMYRSTNELSADDWDLIESNTIERSLSGTNEWWDEDPPDNSPAYYQPAILWEAE